MEIAPKRLAELRKGLGFAWLAMVFFVCLWAQFQARPQREAPQIGRLSERLALLAQGSTDLSPGSSKLLLSLAKEVESDPLRLAVLEGKNLKVQQLETLSPGYRLLAEHSTELLTSPELKKAEQRLYLCLGLLALVMGVVFAMLLVGRSKAMNCLKPMNDWGAGKILALFMGWHVVSLVLLSPLMQVLFIRGGHPTLFVVLIHQLINYGLMLGALKIVRVTRWNLNFPCSFVFSGLGYFLCYLLVFSCNAVFAKLVGEQLSSNNPLLDLFGSSNSWGIMALAGLVIIVGPCFEEIVFRGWLLAGLRQSLGQWPAVLASSALFALVHADLWATPALFILGCVFAWTALRSGSLWASIALHALWNASSFIFVLASLP